jgi:hypothetical protein
VFDQANGNIEEGGFGRVPFKKWLSPIQRSFGFPVIFYRRWTPEIDVVPFFVGRFQHIDI